MSLIAELQRRNVFRVGAAYLALGWVVAQVTGLVAPALHLSESILSTVIWIGAIGFPFVIVFAWAYEITPDGLRRESEVDRSRSITHATGRRLDYITIGFVVLAVALFAYGRLVPQSSAPTEAMVPPESRVTPAPASAPAVASASAPIEADARSIAVLPFVNMSSDKEQEYFSDGIAEELLNLLARIPELRVTSRSSAFSFKGQNLELPEIARRLHVAHILEGSVRKSGDKVRITAQLLDARTDTHLWSQTFDRKLDDIFAVQDEIAGAVVAQLKLSLLGEAPKSTQVDARAYALYMQAVQLYRRRTEQSIAQSIALLQQALGIAPGYATAWAALAPDYMEQANKGLVAKPEAFRLAREAVDRALALDPDNAPAHAQLGAIAMRYDIDLAAAARHFTHALALDPSNVVVLHGAARLAASLGRLDPAIAILEYEVARDPVSPFSHVYLCLIYDYARRHDDAIASCRTALQLAPDFHLAHYNIGVALMQKGEFEAALAEMEQESGGHREFGLAMVQHALGRTADSDATIARLAAEWSEAAAYNLAYIYAFRNEPDRAFDWLDKAVTYKDAGLSEVAVEPLFANIRNDPRWLPFLQRNGMAPEQLAAIPFEVKLPQ